MYRQQHRIARGGNFETYCARYIVKYAQGQKDKPGLQKGANSAFQKAKEQKDSDLQALENEADKLQTQDRQSYAMLRSTENGMEKSVQTFELMRQDQSQQYELIQLKEAVPPGVFIEELEKQSGGLVEYIQPDFAVSLAAYEPGEAQVGSALKEGIPENNSDVAASQIAQEQVTVALLDTGVDMTHPDLAGHLTKGYDFYHDTEEVRVKEGSLEDVHGTHIAGVIAQAAPTAKIMPLKVFENGKAYTSDIIEAIEYAQQNGASVVNCSWGSTENNLALRETMEQSSMLFVCAAGNNRTNLDSTPLYPAAFGLKNTISVAALNQDFGMSYFSNYGDSVDIAAIGREVTSAYLNGEHGNMDGTSVAAGYVTGAAANVAAVCQDAAMLKTDLKYSADKLSCLQGKVMDGNCLNAENLVNKTSGRTLEVFPAEDFDVLGYERTPAENWELFSQLETVQVASGSGFSLFLKSDGTVWGSGKNLSSSGEPILTPTQIPGLTNIVKIAAGYSALALRSDGTVYGCGFSEGAPYHVAGLTDVKSIAVSATGHQLVVKNDGTVWGWGENHWGQAGGSETIVEETEWGAILVGFEYVSAPTQMKKQLNSAPYVEMFTGAEQVYGGLYASYIVDENNSLWMLGYRGYGTTPDAESCLARNVSENVKEVAAGPSGLRLELSTDGKANFYGGPLTVDFSATQFEDVKSVNGNLVLKNDGTVWRWNYGEDTQSELTVEQITGIDHVARVSYGYGDSAYGSWIYHALMVKEDGTVWGVGDNAFGEQGDGTTTPVLTPQKIELGPSVIVGETLIDEQYGTAGNPAYHLNQPALEQLGWSEYDQPEKGGNNWQSPDLGAFDASTGQLLMKKTGSINTPEGAGNTSLVYAVDKIFTHRQENWNEDPRVSVWTQNFKGTYAIEVQGSFLQTEGQVYYDVLGYRNDGIPTNVARYKINPGTAGTVNVYNNRLNGGNVTDYAIFTNPRQNRTICTTLSSDTSTYQTFLDNSSIACTTTVEGTQPNDTFNMTGWNANQPGAYINGIRISVQKREPQDTTAAALDAVKLIEINAAHDVVDDALANLSMSTLTDTPERVETNLKPLPDTVQGASVTWTSSRPDILTDSGQLLGERKADTEVTMTAKITNPSDQFTKYMEFRLTLKANTAPPDPVVLVDEQYGAAGNPFHHMDQNGLLQNGWSEYDEPDKGGNNWQSPDLGELSATSGQLIVTKTGAASQPAEASKEALVYSVDKTFTYRQDNWRGDPRMSMWTQNFKGDYSVEMKGSFHQSAGQVYYDMLGVSSTGATGLVGRYKIGSGSTGKFSVYNNKLNGGGVTDYPLWNNPTANRKITTRLQSQTAEFQTFLNGSSVPSATTAAGADPSDRFSMSGWNAAAPGAYLKGVRFSVQKQAGQGDAVVKLDSLRLIENAAVHTPVDDALQQLSMSNLTDTPDAVTNSLKPLPTSANGIPITWTSSHPELLSNNGELVGEVPGAADVVMTAKLTDPSDQFTKYVDFRLALVNQNGFAESYDTDVTGTPSANGMPGTEAFPEYPMWSFRYPGIANGTNGEIHNSQVLVKDGFLTLYKVSDRQTDNYQECLVGERPLSRTNSAPSYQGKSELSLTAKVKGTGKLHFSPVNMDGVKPFIVALDASTKQVSVTYGETQNGTLTRTEQKITAVDPTALHTYTLKMDTAGSFELWIDGQAAATASGETVRAFLPGTTSGFKLSKLRTWITNITKANTPVGQIQRIVFFMVAGGGDSPLEPVNIVMSENPALYGALKKARTGLDSANSGIITPAELENITGTLDLSYAGLDNIAGLQSCNNIHTLYLEHNQLTDLSPLRGLEKLNTVVAHHNLVQSAPSLKGTPVVTLDLEENQLSDVTLLREAVTLKTLFLGGNQISDASGLSALVGLQTLKIDRNSLTNLDFVSGMLDLRYLNASNNQITSLQPVRPLLLLSDLRVSYNEISDITPLRSRFYRYLYLDHNRLNLVDSMEKLEELKAANLWFYPQKAEIK